MMRGAFGTQSKICDGDVLRKKLTAKTLFCWLFSQKTFFADVGLGSKYASGEK